jgi:hypothetical protein
MLFMFILHTLLNFDVGHLWDFIGDVMRYVAETAAK